MSRCCDVCQRKPSMGNQVETRGKAKYLGGVGTKITGISRRSFAPNLQHVRVTLPNGTNRRLRVCTRCIRSGSVRKVVQQKPFKLPKEASKA
jgi:large subunit ribosomal protein L28